MGVSKVKAYPGGIDIASTTVACLSKEKRITMKHSQMSKIFKNKGLRWH